MNRTISEHGISLLKELEGSRATAYRDSGGAWTIGVGHLVKPTETELLTATLSEHEIDQLLRADLQFAEHAVNEGLKVPVHQSQFDALVSFAFNVGTNAFLDSTLLKEINAKGERAEITAQFMRWTKDNGREVTGLRNRRRREVALYWQHLGTLAILFMISAAILLIGAAFTVYA